MTTEIAPDPKVTADQNRHERAETAPVLDIVIPVYNEAHTLAHCVETLRAYLDASLTIPARITIADNASTDDTLRVAHSLAAAIDGVRVVHLDAKGRGRALRRVWAQSDARVLVYMDVDLSTDLRALHPLVAPLLSGHSDLAIGTRLGRGANVV
ncbi:glycosyltransferase, partial [Tsukamurella paurometabola]